MMPLADSQSSFAIADECNEKMLVPFYTAKLFDANWTFWPVAMHIQTDPFFNSFRFLVKAVLNTQV
jgi:hypothetical protein